VGRIGSGRKKCCSTCPHKFKYLAHKVAHTQEQEKQEIKYKQTPTQHQDLSCLITDRGSSGLVFLTKDEIGSHRGQPT